MNITQYTALQQCHPSWRTNQPNKQETTRAMQDWVTILCAGVHTHTHPYTLCPYICTHAYTHAHTDTHRLSHILCIVNSMKVQQKITLGNHVMQQFQHKCSLHQIVATLVDALCRQLCTGVTWHKKLGSESKASEDNVPIGGCNQTSLMQFALLSIT